MNAEEFILIPKNMYMQQRPMVQQILQNPNINATGKQLSILQRYAKPQQMDGMDQIHTAPVRQTVKEMVMGSLLTFNEGQKKRSSHIYDKLTENEHLSIDNNGHIEIDAVTSGLLMSTFLYDIQQPTKRLQPIHEDILNHLGIPDHVVANKEAKTIISSWVPFSPSKPRRGTSVILK